MIKYIIAGVLVMRLAFSPTPVTIAESPVEPEPPLVIDTIIAGPELLDSLIAKYSKQYNVSSTKMKVTLLCEMEGYAVDQQSRLTYKAGNRWGFPAGTREKSYGWSQIHLPDHPEVTYEQATNPEFAVEFMAKAFSKGQAGIWTCYRLKFW